jgi:superfamily II DNA or RNA helicase
VRLSDISFESAKVAAVIAELKNKTRETRDEKSVVFSQFARFLDVLERALQQHGITYTRLDGSMSRDLRGENMRRFHQDASIKVLLATLKSGGMGLNLVVANNVLLTDPWWNAAAELQAMDRVHRVGQVRKVRVVRFVTKRTVEERVADLQRKKTAMITAAMQQQLTKKVRDARCPFRARHLAHAACRLRSTSAVLLGARAGDSSTLFPKPFARHLRSRLPCSPCGAACRVPADPSALPCANAHRISTSSFGIQL